MGAGGYPPSVMMVKRMAEEMAYYCDKDGKYDQRAPVPSFGKNWMDGFRDCNPGVKTMYTRPRDVKRTEGTEGTEGINPERVQPFYQALKDLQQRY
jgi:hypothetical protein